MPARQHAASVGIIPTLNWKIEIAAPTESRRAQGSTLENFGASNAKGKACTGSTSRKIVWIANQIARLRMTPTTAAVIAESDAVRALLPRSASMYGPPRKIQRKHGTKVVHLASVPPSAAAIIGSRAPGWRN